MELVYIEAPQVPVYKHLHITSYFCKMVAQSRDSETQELILKQLKHTFINNKKNPQYFQALNMTNPGTCQRFLMLQRGLLLKAPHHVV